MRNPNDVRATRAQPGSPLWIGMTVVSIGGMAVLLLAVKALAAKHDPGWLLMKPLFWVVAAMILAGEIWRIITPGRSGGESPAVSRTISVGVMLYWGFPVAVLLRAIAVIIVGLAHRNPLQRVLFNAAQLSLALGASWLVLRTAGVVPVAGHHFKPDLRYLSVVALSAAAYFAVNFCIMAIVTSVRTRTPLKSVVKANLPYQAISHVVLYGSAPLVTVAMATRSSLMLALFAFPVAAVYFSAAMSVKREHQANHDELTGLLNRKLLAKRSGEALSRASTLGTKSGFLLIDLDRSTGLKQVNDTLGHAVGDRLLQVVAHRLAHSVRPGDVVARLGGDEFAVLLPSVKEAGAAREVASRLRAALAEPVRLEAMTFHVQASIGIAIYPDDASTFEQLMQRADVAMYLAKQRHSGIERYKAHADRNSADRLTLLGELRDAIRDNEIELYFQPKIRLADQQVIGMEALARWTHPDRGLLSAADFVGLAEQTHLTSELTEQVLDKALDQAARWRSDGMPVQVSVNLPARDLLSRRLVDLVSQALSRHDLPPEALRLDVNEQVLAGKADQSAEAVRALTDMGVGVSLDDFGTGYSSLAQLTRMGISEVKLDPALVSGVPDCPDRSMTVKSLVKLAQSLGITSIGEGVETPAAAEALRQLGCDGAQGWHFARPLSATLATQWLADHLVAVPGASFSEEDERVLAVVGSQEPESELA
jgi:diguanylate cyclase (GGDEF)-like protein